MKIHINSGLEWKLQMKPHVLYSTELCYVCTFSCLPASHSPCLEMYDKPEITHTCIQFYAAFQHKQHQQQYQYIKNQKQI